MSLSDDLSWWERFRSSDGYRRLQNRPVAYFCAEFALVSSLKTYSGGLGIFAGDILREAAEQKLPMVGVGLVYDQTIEDRRWKVGVEDRKSKVENINPSSISQVIEPVTAAGQLLTVKVPIQDRYVTVAAYRYPSIKLGQNWRSGGERTAPVYLLSTDCGGNDPRDCRITDRLYPQDKEKRLQQEIILGLGGLRLMESLGIHPSVYHLNEGHSAFLALELIRHEMSERMIGFDDALNLVKRRVVFTNHTLAAAGHDIFSNDLAAVNLTKYAEELAVPVDRLVNLGLIQESSLFSMTMLSLRLVGKINAVSRLHAAKAGEIWKDHPMEGITNGVHVGTWDRIEASEKSAESAKISLNPPAGAWSASDWRAGQIADESDKSDSDPSDLSIIRSGPPGAGQADLSRDSDFFGIWQSHLQNKLRLLAKIKSFTGHNWSQDCLLLGWARRFVGYKRPLSIFFDPAWLTAICTRPGRPVRIVISGNVQEGNEEGEKLLDILTRSLLAEASKETPGLKNVAVYLPNYDMELSQLLTAGCDVWLNTPVVGFEACGTSGMKAALNGVLPVSTKDGWMAEIDPIGIGWIVDSDRVSDSLYKTLEHQVIPLYFDHPQEWLKNMASARQLILENFTTVRVLKEYLEKLYLPTLTI